MVFDKYSPSDTDSSRPGPTHGLKAGYSFPPDKLAKGYFFIGTSLSLHPSKPTKIYPQFELLIGLKGQTRQEKQVKVEPPATPPSGVTFYRDTIKTTIRNGTSGFLVVDLPVMLRKNFGQLVGVGLGISLRSALEHNPQTVETSTAVYSYELMNGNFEPVGTPEELTSTKFNFDRNELDMHFSAFGDLTLGDIDSKFNVGIRSGAYFTGGAQAFVQITVGYKL